MRNYVNCCAVLVLVLACALPIDAADISAFISPESRFISVEGTVNVNPDSNQFSFLLFPNAQITLLWIDGLQNYRVERGSLGTVITVIGQDSDSEQQLELSYEGFLDIDDTTAWELGRDQLWFPEFTVPSAVDVLNLRIPNEWTLIEPHDAEVESGRDFLVFSWNADHGAYPYVKIAQTDDLLAETELVEAEVEPELEVEPTPEAEMQPEPEVEPTPEVEAEPELEVVESEDKEPIEEIEPGQSVVELRPVDAVGTNEAEIDAVLPAEKCYIEQKLRDRIAYLDELLSNGEDQAAIESLLSTELIIQGLGKYLTALPSDYVNINTQITDITIIEQIGRVAGEMYIDELPLFSTTMKWEERNDTWIMTEFKMAPLAPSAPPELINLFMEFVNELRRSIADNDADAVASLLAMTVEEQSHAVQFLMSLNPENEWAIHAVSPEALGLTLLIPHSQRTTLVLNLQLIHDPTGWRIISLDSYPI